MVVVPSGLGRVQEHPIAQGRDATRYLRCRPDILPLGQASGGRPPQKAGSERSRRHNARLRVRVLAGRTNIYRLARIAR